MWSYKGYRYYERICCPCFQGWIVWDESVGFQKQYYKEVVTVTYGKESRPRSESKKWKLSVTGCGNPKGCEKSRQPHFLDNLLTDGNKVVSLRRWPAAYPSPLGGILLFISVRGRLDPTAVRLEGLAQLENPERRNSRLRGCQARPSILAEGRTL
jgi:hypothetical protein